MNIRELLRFKIAYQTMKDHWKVSIILTLLFMVMAAMYAGMFPAFEDTLTKMVEEGMAENYTWLPGASDMATYVGFLNLELYQIFWMLILGIIIGFISASIISKEIEGKNIDLLMSNPISRKQIVFEKFIGLIPMILLINFATMLTVIGTTIAINEDLNFANLYITHIVSIPYLLAIISLGILISVIIDEKMKASIITIAILVGMFIFNSIGHMIPDYKNMTLISINNYFDPYSILKFGEVDIANVIVLVVVITVCLIIAMIYFEHKDIAVS
jgi:ABC-2 type transport system permease protein